MPDLPGLSYAAIGPSTSPRYGAGVAVSAMTNAQLQTFLFNDVSLGSSGTGTNNGLIDRIADGRASTLQDNADRMYCRRVLGLGNAG